ncbi:MAG: carbohydrate binding family 9 domain-containing protein [Bacteroidales bacterium]|nr:carbohydrate binding family 9 domain-containing protein [Bacteroidales bacterium]
MRGTAFVFTLFILLNSLAEAQGVRQYTAGRISGTSLTIDGRLEEEAWHSAHWAGDFIQHEPYNGAPATQKTEFAVLFDDNNVYVGIKAFDTHPDSIDRRLTRKDQEEGDMVMVAFDSYHDRLTAFFFGVNAGGVKTDYVISENGENKDRTWDPIWYVKTRITAEGWQAEMRIPLTQLRFEKKSDGVWGLEVIRVLFRRQEVSLWQHVPKESSGFVHLFGELQGLDAIKPHRQVEIAPYGVAQAERFEKEAGNPFMTGKSSALKGGIDGKIGLTNNLIMDFTVNPDFGQVEADPSQVNLTAYETYYREQRPFFVEGKNIYSFPLMIGDGDMSNDNLFYSRRIGRSPHYYPDLGDHEYFKTPTATRILGAAKITGKTRNGLSLGFLESVTAREQGEMDSEGVRRKIDVEPLTNYFVGRMQKDFDKGNTTFGAMVTSVNRDIRSPELTFLPTSAYTGGIDFARYWKNRNYYVAARAIFSNISGSREAITEVQQSPARYFQRPDNFRLDTSLTTLTGHGGRLEIGKIGGGKWNYGAFVNWKSPGLELNDAGFLRDADMILQIFWTQYRILQPKGKFLRFNLFLDQYSVWDFNGISMGKGIEANAFMQFVNYWTFRVGSNIEGQNLSKEMLRGGPYMKLPGGFRTFFGLGSDERKKLNFNIFGNGYFSFQNAAKRYYTEAEIQYRPLNVFQVSLIPSLMQSNEELQYIDTYFSEGKDQYLFARIKQNVLSTSVRLNLTLLPGLNIQYWGQPFVASGKYSHYKLITDPKAASFDRRYEAFSPAQLSYDKDNQIFLIDKNTDGTPEYTFGLPDFNVKQFRSNLVVKWEYIPGSYLYLVWSQSRDRSDPTGVFMPGEDLADLFSKKPHNVWLIKFSYRFSL